MMPESPLAPLPLAEPCCCQFGQALLVQGLEVHFGQVQRGIEVRVIASAMLARRYG